MFCLPLMGQTNSNQYSPSLVEASARSVGMSQERIDRIDEMCQAAIANSEVPGIVALVARHGKVVLHKAYGSADKQSNRTLERDDIFRIASQSKAITSTAVMMLWEEGEFQLDDPISKYIPAFKDEQVLDSFDTVTNTYTTIPASKPITIRHLLSHTSGIGYGVIDGNPNMKKIYADAGVTDLFTTENISIEESVLKLAKLPLHHHPGERFTYSEGLDVLGYFIEVISGQPFDVFLRERIFDPLGMDDTWFYLPRNKLDRLVKLQHMVDGSWQHFPTTFYDPDYPIKGAKRFFSGGAGLSSTAKDYATFLQMYLNKGELNGIRILSRTTVDLILSCQVSHMWGSADKCFGLAFSILQEGGADKGGQGTEGTFEWGGYFNTQYFVDPLEGIVGVLLKQTQGTQTDQTAWKFKQLIGQAIDN